jgi:hypothetical protein
MVDTLPPAGLAVPLGTKEELRDVWERYRRGASVPCPADAVPMALAVDAAAGAYRFVCTQCGVSSAWFESSAHGIVVRGYSAPGVSGAGPAGG